jgi:hypothetical protein
MALSASDWLRRKHKGNTAQRPPDGFARHLPHIFSVIFHKNARAYTKYALRFLFHLTKNLTAHLTHNLCAVSPLKKFALRLYFTS